ncbi:MAG TPA: hypothetical protein VFV58_00110 [Blastocatellia bacterium]|jgi:hypothetical protein|nr:hypothetical protein [Blastocatellia bacterium]
MKHSTNRSLFKTVTPVLAFIIALAAPSFLAAQSKSPIAPTQSLSAAPTANEVYSWARTAKEKLPTSAAWDKAKPETETQRSLLRLIKRGQSIIERAVERGAAMSATEAANYDNQMRTVVEQMDKLSAGAIAKGDSASCFGGCDKLYKGWGKGKGWNRFWCKVGCFKIEVHVG